MINIYFTVVVSITLECCASERDVFVTESSSFPYSHRGSRRSWAACHTLVAHAQLGSSCTCTAGCRQHRDMAWALSCHALSLQIL